MSQLINHEQDLSMLSYDRLLSHPSIKTFWNSSLSTHFQLPYEEFLETLQLYCHSKNYSLTNVNLEEIFQDHHRMVNVLDLQQQSRYFAFSLTLVGLLEVISQQQSYSPHHLFFPTPSVNFYENYPKEVLAMVHRALVTPNSWTLVSGESTCGKTSIFLYYHQTYPLMNSHSFYLDCSCVTSEEELMMSIAVQYSIVYLTQDDFWYKLERILTKFADSENSTSQHQSIILDHVSLSMIGVGSSVYEKLFGLLINLQSKSISSMSIVLILLSEAGHISSTPSDSLSIIHSQLSASSISRLEIPKLSMENYENYCQTMQISSISSSILYEVASYGNIGAIIAHQRFSKHQLESYHQQRTAKNDLYESILTNEEKIALYGLISLFNAKPIKVSLVLAYKVLCKFYDDNSEIFYATIQSLKNYGLIKALNEKEFMLTVDYNYFPSLVYHPKIDLSPSYFLEQYLNYIMEELIFIQKQVHGSNLAFALILMDSIQTQFLYLSQQIFSSQEMVEQMDRDFVVECSMRIALHLTPWIKYGRLASTTAIATDSVDAMDILHQLLRLVNQQSLEVKIYELLADPPPTSETPNQANSTSSPSSIMSMTRAANIKLLTHIASIYHHSNHRRNLNEGEKLFQYLLSKVSEADGKSSPHSQFPSITAYLPACRHLLRGSIIGIRIIATLIHSLRRCVTKPREILVAVRLLNS
jgi:hypothetical protein